MKDIMLRQIAVSIPGSTFEMERSRTSELKDKHDFLQCFAGSIQFLDDDGNIAILLRDVPVLGVLTDLMNAAIEIRDGSRTETVTDFYGEFELQVHRANIRDSGSIAIENTATGEAIASDHRELVSLLKQASRDVGVQLSEWIPAVTTSSIYREVLEYIDRQ